MAQQQDGWNNFIKLCLSAKTPALLSQIFGMFLTTEEKADITTRCLIVKSLLAKDKTQRELSKDLKVSIAKITRGSNELKRQEKKLLKFFEKHFI